VKYVAARMLSAAMLLCILTGCTTADNAVSESEVSGPLPEVMEFRSLDRLLSAYESGGLAHIGIDSSTKLYLPAVVPDGFELYSVAASDGSVLLMYLPQEYTDSLESVLDAQRDNKHFALWYALPNTEMPNTTAGLLEQFDASENDLVAGKYLFNIPTSFLWADEGTMFSVSLPITMITPFATALRDENFDGMEILNYDGFGDLLVFLGVEAICVET